MVLHTLCLELLFQILQWLDLRTRRVLRAVHPVLRQNIEDIDSSIFQWSLFKPINPRQLIQFSLDVGRIEGLYIAELRGREDINASLEIISRNHSELLSVRIGNAIELSDTGISALLSNPSLQHLELENTSMTGETLEENLSYSSKLRSLSIKCSSLNDKGLQKLLKICKNNLNHLNVSGCNISDSGILHTFYSCENLKSFSFGPTSAEIDCVSLVQYTGKCKINDLDCSYCYNLADIGLHQLLRICGENLTSLDLTFTKISGEIKSIIIPNLVKLNCSMCRNLTDEGLSCLISKCSQTLNHLFITHTKISDNFWSSFKCRFPYISILNLHQCKSFTDIGLLHVFNICGETLKYLNIGYTMVSGDIKARNEILSSIQTLDCVGCSKLADSGLINLVQVCSRRMKNLNIGEHGGRISEKCLQQLENMNLNLLIIKNCCG